MLAVSFQSLDANEVGIRRSKHYGFVNSEEVQTTGNHYVGLWYKFDTLSKTQQNGEYTVTAFTNNVIGITIETAVQYQVDPTYDNLYGILYDYDKMGEYFDSRVKDAIRRGIQAVESDALMTARASITNVLSTNVREAVAACGYTMNSFQILEIEIPAEIQTAITESVQATLGVGVAQEQRERDMIAAENQRIQDKHSANVTATQQAATATANYNSQKALLDAELYAMTKAVENLENLVQSYQTAYPIANATSYMQIMELVKTHKYNSLLGEVAASGNNKIVVDHKPSAIGDIGQALADRLAAAESG